MRKAFTLIELLVVVAIIAILLGLMMPALGQARREGTKAVCGSNLKGLGVVFGFYRDDQHGFYPCRHDPVNMQNNWWLWMGRGWRPIVEPYLDSGTLDATNPSILWCPGDKSDKYENTSYSYSMSFYHSPGQINQMKDKSCTYSNPVAGVGIQAERVAMPSRKILAGEWCSNHKPISGVDPGWWGFEGSRNFLFADGHVEFLAGAKIKLANDSLPDANLTVDGVEGSDL